MRNAALIKKFKVKLIMEDKTIKDFCRENSISYETYNDFRKGKTTGVRGEGAKKLVNAIKDFIGE